MRFTVAALLLLACGPRKSPAAALAQSASGPDALELLAAAQALPGSELRWGQACLRAGVRSACEQFVAEQPLAERPRLTAFLRLAFGEPEAAEQLVKRPGESAGTRRDLSLGIARHYRRGDSNEAKLRARAALKAADALDATHERLAERKLITASLAVANREFATATTLLRELVESDLPLAPDQRDELIRIGQLNAERAADTQRDATDQARKLFASLNRLSPDEAVAESEQLAQRQPDSSLAWLALGFARLKAADEPGAVLAWEKARALCAFDPEPDFQLAKLHERRSRYSRAVYFLERGMQVAPAWPKGLWLMADVAMLAREPEAAAKALQRLKRLFPEDVMVDLGRARTLLDRDEGLRAMAVLKEAVRDHPTDVRPALALVRTALTLHERAQSVVERERLVSEAERALKSAEQVTKDSNEVQTLRTAVERLKKP